MRLEGDGSIVIAGNAAPNAKVEILIGSKVIGSAVAGPDGDFAIVLDEPLKPGDYQIVLRATAPDNVVAMSVETAVVSVPATPTARCWRWSRSQASLADHRAAQAGKPAPDAKPHPEAARRQRQRPGRRRPARRRNAAALPGSRLPRRSACARRQRRPSPPLPADGAVEAVEIDGSKIFVAGLADPGRTVRGYANEILLGDATASPDGQFLIEAERAFRSATTSSGSTPWSPTA